MTAAIENNLTGKDNGHMEYNKKIADMRSGDAVEGFYILKGAYPKTTAAGKPFLSASLSDTSGVIEAKVWDYSGPIGSGDEGKVIKLRGTVSEYRGSPQIVIDRIRLRAENDPVDLSALVPVAPIDADVYLQKVDDMVDSIGDADYQRLCRELLRRHLADFQQIPAAKSVHHGFLRGLLMHTVDMLTMADFLANQYRAIIDRDLLLAGTLLHDFAKAKEFAFSELGLVTGYSTSGQLLGHLVMGAQEVADTAKELGVPDDKSMLVQHMILSHHGEPEFGAAVRPLFAEAELLSHIDAIDSRMEIYREVLNDLSVGEFSDRIFALERRVYKPHELH